MKKKHTIFKGKIFEVCTTPLDHHRQGEMVIHPGAATVIPLLDNQTIIMIQNQRFVVGKTLLELPAGIIEKNEKPIETAKRELQEETGYIAGSIEKLLKFYSSPGYSTEMIYTFIAKDLIYTEQNLDFEEKIKIQKVPIKHIREMIKQNMIEDGKTIVSLLYFLNFNHKG